jgi:hypothetical protein
VDVRDRRSPTFDLSDLGATMQQKLARWALRRQRRLETVMKPTQIKELDEMLGLLARYLESLGGEF